MFVLRRELKSVWGGVDLMGVVVWVHFEVWEGSRWLWLFDLSGYVC